MVAPPVTFASDSVAIRTMAKSLSAVLLSVLSVASVGLNAQAAPVARTASGRVQGLALESGVARFAGIPFAAPPVGALRWKPPQPTPAWAGVRPAVRFADQCMQARPFSDMVFRNEGTSEDCLYLNVWTSSTTAAPKMPVLVYFYGGGFVAGDGSEPRYDGAAMARRGIVVVTLSYRLGIFGAFAHPALAAESATGAAGNYGLMDQTAALRWVKANIASFGGDPSRVTIAGESAGSFSVSAQMASPMARELFAGAIGESGSLLNERSTVATAERARQDGEKFARVIGASSLAQLRALSAHELLAASSRDDVPRFGASIDGAFLPESPNAIFAQGKQARVPLLAGWNSEEMSGQSIVREPTAAALDSALQRMFGARAGEARAVYGGTSTLEIAQTANDLASDQWIAYGTWKWLEEQSRIAPVYRYYFSRARPAPVVPERPRAPNAWSAIPRGANHSAEIEYAMGNLPGNPVFAWTDADRTVSATMMSYFENFIKTGTPNGAGLPMWPEGKADAKGAVQRMRLDVQSGAEAEPRARYLFLKAASASR